MQIRNNRLMIRLAGIICTPYSIVAVIVFWVMSFCACDQQVNQQGRRLYASYCASCHMENGEGLRQIVPALTDKEFLSFNRNRLGCIIREGISGPMVINGKKFDRQMAGIPELNNIAIHNLINFIFQSWGNDLPKMQLDELNKSMESCAREYDDRRLDKVGEE